MAVPREDARAANHIGPLKNEKMKTYAVRDSSQRVEILYEAVAHAAGGDPCLATIYYYETSNNVPTATKEKEAEWDATWDFDVPVNGE
jgi:hypothetical protein